MSIYISLYQDGVYRQRCQEHLDVAPANRLAVSRVVEGSLRVTCPACWWMNRMKGGEGNVVASEVEEPELQ